MLPTNNPHHRTSSFTTLEGWQLFCQSWLPAAPPKAHVLLVHGFGEHSGRYGNVVTALTAADYAVHAYDTRGHGRSPGQRGHIDGWHQYRSDLYLFTQLIAAQHSGAALYLYGHSLGALMVLDFLLYHSGMVQGAIVSGAPIEPVGVAKPWLVALARLASQWMPKMPAPVPIKPTDLSRDPEVVAALINDPLKHTRATARWGTETLATIERVKREAKKIVLPQLFIHGGDDPINSVAGVTQLVQAFPADRVAFHVYPGRLHEPHNDWGHEVVMADVRQWLDEQSQQVNTAS